MAMKNHQSMHSRRIWTGFLSSTSIDTVQKCLSLLFPREEALQERDLDGKVEGA